MMIGVLESTFFLNFFSYTASAAGLFIGILGIAMYVGKTKKQDDMHNYWDENEHK
jgi:putative Mn2+ efflux pump MntP